MRMDRNHRGRGRALLAEAAMLAARHGNWGGGPGGFFGGGWGDEGFGGRRSGRARMFGSGELRLVLLKLIADEPRHGYQLIKAIEDLTEGAYAPSPGVVYPTLSLLEDEEAIESVVGEGPRKAFAITDKGRAELAEKQEEAERILARLTERGEGRRGRHAPQIGRAIGNLMMVLGQSARDELTPERRDAIVDVLDEAAKRIERL